MTPSHRGGSGPPIVLLHGFLDTWRTWELVLPALERRHDVLAGLQLAARGRARSVVALAPAGGWARGDESYRQTLRAQAELVERMRRIAPRADAILATPEGRRLATSGLVTSFEHIPAELILGFTSADASASM